MIRVSWPILLASSKHEQISVERKELDEILNLPGLTFKLPSSIKSYSGYLNGAVSGNYLHYWRAANK